MTTRATTNCAGCRYWSELKAQARPGRAVEAVCIAPRAMTAMSGAYVTGLNSCAGWASGHDGAVDDPKKDPQWYDKTVDSCAKRN